MPVETKVETKGGEKLARGRVRGEKAVDGEKISASKKRREKKKKAKAARAAGKADGDIPAKQTHAAIEYLREWAKAQATSDSTPTHGWKFQKVRQTWLLKNSTDPSKIVKVRLSSGAEQQNNVARQRSTFRCPTLCACTPYSSNTRNSETPTPAI